MNELEEIFITFHEGIRLKAYKDTLGYWTIGCGILVTNKFFIYGLNKNGSLQVDKKMSKAMTELAIEKSKKIIAKKINISNISKIRLLALTSMAYNLGTKIYKFKKMFSAIEKNDYKTAKKEALNSKWAKQVGQRAEDISYMILNDEFPSRFLTYLREKKKLHLIKNYYS